MSKNFLHKYKCVVCGLHFTVATYHENWPLGKEKKIWCPECGDTKAPKIHWREAITGFIFQVVPGNAELLLDAFTGGKSTSSKGE